MSWRFTQKKMLALPQARQHKNCAEILRDLYLSPSSLLLQHYNDIQEWLALPSLGSLCPEAISNRYHWHLRQSDTHWKEHNLLPQVRHLDRAEGQATWPIAIYLDGLRSAHNVGSIIRTVEAFSLGSLCLSEGTPGPDNKQVRDSSMGTVDWVEIQRKIALDALPRPIIALETAEGATPIGEYPFPDQFTLVVGNEEYGCSKEILAKADALVEIPLRGRKNSLNVANAFAIAAAAIAHQRTHPSSTKTY